MKTIKNVILLAVAVASFAALNVQAYFDPSVGRWASRDPIGEPGFELSLAANKFSLSSRYLVEAKKNESNPYLFVQNNSINQIDLYGLLNAIILVQTEIRAPDPESGTKTWHYVEIDDHGTVLAQQSFIGLTQGPFWPLPPLVGHGSLSASVSGSSPQFTVDFKGDAISAYFDDAAIAGMLSGSVVGITAGSIASQLRIDYDIPVMVDFCSRKGTVSGAHDGYPSYMVSVNGNKVYDFAQTTIHYPGIPINFGILKLLPPMDVSPKVSFTW